MDEPLIKDNDKKNITDKIKNKINNLGLNCDIYQSANFFSKLLFYWPFRVIRLANFTALKTHYFGKVTGKNKSEAHIEKLKYYWNVKGYKHKTKHRLLLTSLRANICKFFIKFSRDYHSDSFGCF
jgi:hypothetical protein